MKKFFITFTLFSALLYSGCSDQQASPSLNTQPDQTTVQKTVESKAPLKIVTSFYPIYAIVREIGGDNVKVTNLVPAGAEPHDYEPTPKDMVTLNQADLVIYNGVGLEPWADKIVPDLQKSGVKTVNLAMTLSEIFQNEIIVNAPQTPDQEEYLPFDPHLWIDPVNYQKEVQVVSQRLIELDPDHQAEYAQNTQNFLKQLQDLDLAFQNGLRSCRHDSFVTNHAAFAYLAKRYHLTMIPVSGFSPDAEPSPKVLTDLIDTIKGKNIHYILTESLVSPKIAETLANEIGATTLVLNPLEGLTDEEIAQGKNYISVMRDNLKNLQTALECQ